MPSPTPPTDDAEGQTSAESHEIDRRIDDLMAQPPKGRPAITIVGDEHVFAIYPPKA